MFDQAARQAAKIDPPAYFRWLFGLADPPLVFRAWLDPRRLPSAGAADLTGDAVADFNDRSEPDGRFALVLEMQTEPDLDAVERLALYGLGLRLELRDESGKRRVGAAVVNLTGSPRAARLELPIPGLGQCGFFLRPWQRNMADEDAAATLTEIAAGRTGRCLLPWIPLMHGGGESAIIAEWKRLAEQEPDSVLRSVYAALALTFAELTKALVAWQQALENWNMQESQTMLGWIRKGQLEGRLASKREDLLRVLRGRFQTEAPSDLRAAVEGTNDLDILDRWIDAAVAAPSLPDFRATMTAT
jgi:hypothetical protein